MPSTERKIKKMVISGAYGMQNLGDEAICETMVGDIFSLNNRAAITILVFNEDLFFEAHPQWEENKTISVELMNFRKRTLLNPLKVLSLIKGILKIVLCDVFVWGGGGIVRNRPDSLSEYMIPLRIAQFFKKKIIVWSIGVNEIDSQPVIDLLKKIEKAEFFSVRDENSRKNLIKALRDSNKNKIQVIRDPVFHFCNFRVAANPTQGIYNIGLNISFWKGRFSEKNKLNEFINSLGEILNQAHREKNYRLIYLPTSPRKDNVLFQELRERLMPKIKIESPVIHTPTQYLAYLKKLHLFIGMRMHSIILASNVTLLPILGIIYDEKVAALKRELNLPGSIWAMDEVVSKPKLLVKKIVDFLQYSEAGIADFEKFKENSKEIIYHLKEYL